MSRDDHKPGLLAQLFGAGFVLLRTRELRRRLLFGLTAACVIMAGAGVTPLTSRIMREPLWFAIYWGGCLVLVLLLLMLAVYDMMRVRRDYRRNLRDLERKLHGEAESTREEFRSRSGSGSSKDGGKR